MQPYRRRMQERLSKWLSWPANIQDYRNWLLPSSNSAVQWTNLVTAKTVRIERNIFWELLGMCPCYHALTVVKCLLDAEKLLWQYLVNPATFIKFNGIT